MEYTIFRIKDNIVCEKDNPKYLEMLVSFDFLVEYTLFLIEKSNSNGVFTFYNFLFEKYFPEKVPNLSNIDYEEIFLGKNAKKTSDVYKDLLDLWMILQEKTILDSEDIPKLEAVGKKIQKLLNYR